MSGDSNSPSKLNIAHESAAGVPTFACIVYVSKTENGVRARVANLPDLEHVGTSERDVLGKIVPEFKKRVAKWMADGEEIPWVDPPSLIEPNEQKRFVPVHL